MLIGNYSVFNKNPGRWLSGNVTCDRSNWNTPGASRNFYIASCSSFNVNTGSTNPTYPSLYYGKQIGYDPPYSWNIAPLSGGMAAINGIIGIGSLTNGNLAGGLNGAATINGVGSISTATISAIGYLISSLSANGSVSATILGKLSLAATLSANGSINASISALGNITTSLLASGSITTAQGSLVVSAVAAILASSSFTASVLGEEYMYATINGAGSVNTTLSATINASAGITASASMVAAIKALASAVSGIIGSSTITVSNGATPGSLSAGIVIGAADPLSPEALAAYLWNSIAASYNVTGTMGQIMNEIGSGTDPWSTNLPGGYTGIQAGKILADLETLVKQVKALTSANL
jgi:hypothetical protein